MMIQNCRGSVAGAGWRRPSNRLRIVSIENCYALPYWNQLYFSIPFHEIKPITDKVYILQPSKLEIFPSKLFYDHRVSHWVPLTKPGGDYKFICANSQCTFRFYYKLGVLCSNCRKPGVTGRGLYDLKPEFMKEYNPFFYHYTRIEQSKVKYACAPSGGNMMWNIWYMRLNYKISRPAR